jgi:hypothetical protein
VCVCVCLWGCVFVWMCFFCSESVCRNWFFFFYWRHPDVFWLCIPTVSTDKTQLINFQLKWRHVSIQGVITRPIKEPRLRYIKWKWSFLEFQDVYKSERTWIQLRLIFTIFHIIKCILVFIKKCSNW